MVGISRDDEIFSADAHADDALLNEALLAGGKAARPARNSRRSIEELLEEKRLRKQLEDVFDDDFDN